MDRQNGEEKTMTATWIRHQYTSSRMANFPIRSIHLACNGSSNSTENLRSLTAPWRFQKSLSLICSGRDKFVRGRLDHSIYRGLTCRCAPSCEHEKPREMTKQSAILVTLPRHRARAKLGGSRVQPVGGQSGQLQHRRATAW